MTVTLFNDRPSSGGATRGRTALPTALVALWFLCMSTPYTLLGPFGNYAEIIGVILVLFLPKAKAPAPSLPWLPLLFVGWAAMSSLWSMNGANTNSSVIALIAATFSAILLCRRVILPVFLNGIVLGALLALLLSIIYGALYPALGRDEGPLEAGALQGIYVHRNVLAFTLSVGLAAATITRLKGPWGKYLKLTTILALFYGILQTESSTGLVIAISILAIASAMSLVNRFFGQSRAGLFFVLGGFVALGIAVLLDNFEWTARALGRDTTLTGRTAIWAAIRPFIENEPVFGYGWGAVWGKHDYIGQSIRRTVGFAAATHAHNGYLDVILQLGFVGGLLLVAVLVGALVVSGRLASQSAVISSEQYLVLFPIALLIYNMVETRITLPLGWAVIVAVMVYATEAVRRSPESMKEEPSEPHYQCHNSDGRAKLSW